MTTSPLQACLSCDKPLPFGAGYCPACGQKQKDTSHLSMGERRLVTILFADLASFTAVSEKADPEDVIDMLNYVFTRLMVECDREGGFLDKTVGDQLMVLFGAPRAHEDDPIRAVRAALAMIAAMEELAPIMREKVGAACKLNIGIHTGTVVWGQVGPAGQTDPTVIGDAVNLASRLQHAAKEGQILVSEAVYLLTRRNFEFKSLEPISVKNKSGLIPIYLPLHAHQRLSNNLETFESKTPLVERDEQLEVLHSNWSRAIIGNPQIILLRGDAGSGKSRMLMEFANSLDIYAAGKQPLVLNAYCKSATGDNYNPLVSLLYQLFGLTSEDTELIRRRKVEDRARILGITDSRFLPLMGYLMGWYLDDVRLIASDHSIDSLREFAFEVTASLFLTQSTHRPMLLLIDDLHLATLDTMKWLTLLITMSEAVQHDAWHKKYPLMIVIAARPQAEALVALPLSINNVISLSPLSEIGRRELIEHLLPGQGLPLSLIERLSRESEGNPFYLIESTRTILQSKQLIRQNDTWHLTRPESQIEMPQSIEGLMMATLDSLDPINRNILQHAAVIGSQFSYSLLKAITPIEELDNCLENLKQRGLISLVSGSNKDLDHSFTFTHLAMRQVAYQSILRKTRRELHQRIAELAEAETLSHQEDLKILARHFAAGGDQEKLIAYNWLAGQRALNEFNFEEAFRYLDLAWTTLQEMRDSNREIFLNVTHALGDASTFTGKFDQGVTCYQVLEGLIGEKSEEQAWIQYKLGRLYFYQAQVEKASAYYEQALKLAASSEILKTQIEAEIRLLYDIG